MPEDQTVKELAEELEDKGYDWVRQEFGSAA